MNTMIDYVEETMKEKFDLVKLLNILKKNIKLLPYFTGNMSCSKCGINLFCYA